MSDKFGSNDFQVIEYSDIKNKKITKELIKFKAKPLTPNISRAMDSYDSGKSLILHGCAGTGKTFITLSKAIEEVLDTSFFRQVMVFRSSVAIRDMGFLKGTEEEKMAPYEAPYKQIISKMFNLDSGEEMYEKLKSQHYLSFQSTSYNQGITLDNTIMIIDEAQNMTYYELFNLFTRQGTNSKIMLLGDFKKQDMLAKNKKEVSGFQKLIKVIQQSDKLRDAFSIIEMEQDDIVRSDIVKDFIIADHNYID